MFQRMVEDLRQTVDRNRRWAESERSRMETQLMRVVEGNASTTKVKQARVFASRDVSCCPGMAKDYL